MIDILISICARGGSKGVPNKNIKPIANLPLIAYSIGTAQRFQKSSEHRIDIALSTDSDAIKEAAAVYGLHTNYTRPDALATDKAGKLDAMRDILLFEEKQRGKRYDYLLDLDVTAPLRTVQDLEQALEKLQNTPNALNIFSVSPAHRNPYFNMVEETADGFVRLCKPPAGNILSRQSAPKVFDMNASFYYFKRQCFDMETFFTINDKSLAFEMQHVCFDVDSLLDFDVLEYLITHQKLGFQLSTVW